MDTSSANPRLDGIPRPPVGRTARRVEWDMLPPEVRRQVESRLGSPVLEALSATSGYTPGFASVLTCADGRRHFVKAASRTAQKPFAEAYLEEARKLRALPKGLPVPRLLWTLEGEWVVLATSYVEGRAPSRPWHEDELGWCLDALEDVAELLTPAPAELATASFSEELAAQAEDWAYVRRALPDLPHLEEAAALSARVTELDGDTLVHTDVRDDNLLLDAGDEAWLCDWNWPVRGAAWLDTVVLLIAAYGDGLDVGSLLAARPLTRDVDPDLVDVLLAALAGFWLRHRDDPVPGTSPFLRIHQSWYAEAGWAWLCQRRGWEWDGPTWLS